MIVDAYRPEDRAAVDALFRRVFGESLAEVRAKRWDWQYLQNPRSPHPRIWMARDQGDIVGQYATMPVRLWVEGREIDASWGMDVMVAPERQRQGIGEVLFDYWDRHTGASLGMGLSQGSHRLFRKLKWPDVGPVPCLVKPISKRAFVDPAWPAPVKAAIGALTIPLAGAMRSRDRGAVAVPVTRFDDRFTSLWRRVAPSLALAVVRDAEYLEWKYLAPPHVRYHVIAVESRDRVDGYAVYRHLDERRGRVTTLIDLLADPADPRTLRTLLARVESEARAAGSDKVRAFVMNEAYRKTLKNSGFFTVKSTVQLVVKINAIRVDPVFYADTGRWHIVFGDSDQDR